MVHADREPTGRRTEGWLEGAPELAVEIIGDAQSASELAAKALEYLRSGSQAGVGGRSGCAQSRVMVFTLPNCIPVFASDDSLDGGDLLRDFSRSVAELFD